jgi:hypothetical protein
MTAPNRFNRRAFLGAALAGFATVPLLKILERASFAADAGKLKFIGIYHPHGVSAEYWAMRPGETETSFDIAYENCSLQPFDDAATYGKSFKDKILLIEGIDHLSYAGGHESAATILTGSRVEGKKPLNASLDQVLAVDKGLGSMSPVTSVALGVGNDSTESGFTLSHGPGGAGLPKVIDPNQAFDLLFGNFAAPNDAAAQAALARKRRIGQSTLDFIRGEIGDLKPRLGATEQQKLEQHLTSLREIEKRMQVTGTPGSCAVPSTPDATKFPKLKQYNGGEPYFDAITDAQVDLLASAIACGVTRFATLYLNDLSYAGNPLNLPADNHGGVAHTYNPSPLGNNGRPAGNGDPATWLPLARFNKYSYSKIARLMQKLDQLGALEDTLIYATSDMGNPNLHSTLNCPTLLAGGAAGKFRMGRRLRTGPDCPTDNPWCDEKTPVYQGKSNNHVLVAIAQAFGVEIDAFGTQTDPGDATGALDGLT